MKSILIQIALVAAILLGGFAAFRFLAATRPEPVRQVPERILPRVSIATTEAETTSLKIPTQGTVTPRNQARIRSEVGGRILQVSDAFDEGIAVRAGDFLLEIDSADYRAALATAESALAEARLALAIEEAQAQQALLDWERLHPDRDPDPLVVREPQIAARRAAVESASAALERARRDLERTRVTAPFDGRIRSRQVSPGDYVTPGGGTVLGEIDGIELEVRLPIAPHQTLLLDPDAVATVAAQPIPVELSATTPGDTRTWAGEVERFSGTVDPTNRFTHAIVRILPSSNPPAVGAFLHASIQGKTVSDVHRIPRVAVLRDGFVLEARPADPVQDQPTFTLHEIPIDPVQSLRDEALVRIPGDPATFTFSVTPIRAFTEGMAVHPSASDSAAREQPVIVSTQPGQRRSPE